MPVVGFASVGAVGGGLCGRVPIMDRGAYRRAWQSARLWSLPIACQLTRMSSRGFGRRPQPPEVHKGAGCETVLTRVIFGDRS